MNQPFPDQFPSPATNSSRRQSWPTNWNRFSGGWLRKVGFVSFLSLSFFIFLSSLSLLFFSLLSFSLTIFFKFLLTMLKCFTLFFLRRLFFMLPISWHAFWNAFQLVWCVIQSSLSCKQFLTQWQCTSR